jgi:multiple sugar transport system substrate-binding protein
MATSKHGRRALGLAITLLFVVSFVWAGGQQETTVAEPERLVFWSGIPDESGPEALALEFTERMRAAGRDVVVEHVRFVNNAEGNTRLDTALLSGEQIDVYVNYNRDTAIRRIENDLARDLTPFIEADGFDIDENFGALAALAYHEGSPYILPAARSMDVVWYNKTAFDAEGITIPDNWTWDDYRNIARRMTRDEDGRRIYGSLFFPWGGVMWVWSQTYFGGDWRYDADGMSNLDHPLFAELLEMHYEMEQVDQIQMPLAEMIATRTSPQVAYLRGEAYMFGATNAWVMRTLNDREQYPHDFVTAIAPVPRVNDAHETYYTLSGAQDMAVMGPNAGNEDLAWEFLQFYATEGYIHHTPFGRLPGWTGYDPQVVADAFIGENADLYDADSIITYYLESPERIAIPTNFTASAELGTVMYEEYQRAVLGEITAEEAVRNAQQRADQAIAAALERDR